jgi:methylated-DNA-[protein]-cysteine S-methyltransferase
MSETVFTHYQESPLGWLRLSGSGQGIKEIAFIEEVPTEISDEVPVFLSECSRQLKEYFQGERKTFELQLDPYGTGFQQKVWNHLSQVPFGQTRSYLDISLQLGAATYTRAVGSANGRNPIAIVVPCHRVIGSNGTLTGYAGGLWRKKWLLQFEGNGGQAELFPQTPSRQ